MSYIERVVNLFKTRRRRIARDTWKCKITEKYYQCTLSINYHHQFHRWNRSYCLWLDAILTSPIKIRLANNINIKDIWGKLVQVTGCIKKKNNNTNSRGLQAGNELYLPERKSSDCDSQQKKMTKPQTRQRLRYIPQNFIGEREPGLFSTLMDLLPLP